MDDEKVLGRIEELVAEEHRLLHKGETEQGLGPDDHARLGEVKVQLDRCWDLLRQRRAHREFAQDPDDSQPRPRQQVEGYLQ